MPNRIIKESICTSESLSQLSDFEENFFYKIIVNCDDYGRFDARPAILKSRCYPLRERLTLKNIEDALSSLASAGCVELYIVDGKPFLRLPTWEVHQQIRAKKSKFPAPDSTGYQMISDDCKCPRNPIQSNPNPNPNPNPKTKTAHSVRTGYSSSSAVAFFLNHINPTASDLSIDEISGFAQILPEALIIHAMQIAMDEKKTNWGYIRGILRNWHSKGYVCLADVKVGEERRNPAAEKVQGSGGLSAIEKMLQEEGAL